MGTVYYSEVNDGSGRRVLIGGGNTLHFDAIGNYLGQGVPEMNLGTIAEVDIVSVLVLNNEVELAFNLDGVFTKKRTLFSLARIASIIHSTPNMIGSYVRRDVTEGWEYTQYIYVFGTLPKEIKTLLEG